MSWRDLYCGELRSDHIGTRVTVAGWVDTRRDHGGLVFIDLRDHTGKLQLVVNPERAAEAKDAAHELRNEFVIQAEGEVVARAPEAVNPNLPTGEVEIQVDTLRILSRSTPLPFQLDEENVDETLRLRYRWLDMRRDKMQHNFRVQHTAIAGIRRTMDELGFIDVWTPSMTRGTPEGARDFLVPVRLQPGKFFALAQSPQLFKQICMVGGIDRYYQIATCWRDEDLRADRQFEFRQLDLEMAFVEREDVLDVMEQAVVAAFEAVGREPPSAPVRAHRLRRGDREVRQRQAGPALRDGDPGRDRRSRAAPSSASSRTRRPFATSSRRRRSRAPSSAGSKSSRRSGARRASPTSSSTRAGEVRSPIAKFLSEQELAAFNADPGSTVLFGAGDEAAVARVLGLLRLHLGRELGLIDPDAQDDFHWVLDFPLFEQDEETGQWTFLHHPFTAPMPGQEDVGRVEPGGRARPALRPDLERLGARLGLDPDPRRRAAGARVPHDGPQRRGGAVEVRLPARGARDGRPAARRLRDGDRAVRRARWRASPTSARWSRSRRSRAAPIR